MRFIGVFVLIVCILQCDVTLNAVLLFSCGLFIFIVENYLPDNNKSYFSQSFILFLTSDVSHKIRMNSFDDFFLYVPLSICTEPSIRQSSRFIGIAFKQSSSSVAELDRIVYMPVFRTKRSNGVTSSISTRMFSAVTLSASILSSMLRACNPFAGSAAGYLSRS